MKKLCFLIFLLVTKIAFAKQPTILLTGNTNGDTKLIQAVVFAYDKIEEPKFLFALKNFVSYKETFVDSAKTLQNSKLTEKFQTKNTPFLADSSLLLLDENQTDFQILLQKFPKLEVVVLPEKSDVDKNFYLTRENGKLVLFLAQDFEVGILEPKQDYYKFEKLNLETSNFQSLYPENLLQNYWKQHFPKTFGKPFLVGNSFVEQSFINLSLYSLMKKSEVKLVFYSKNDFDLASLEKFTEDSYLELTEANQLIKSDEKFLVGKISGFLLQKLVLLSKGKFELLSVDSFVEKNSTTLFGNKIFEDNCYKVCFSENFYQKFKEEFEGSKLTETITLRNAFLADFENFSGGELLDTERFFKEDDFVNKPLVQVNFDEVSFFLSRNRVKNKELYKGVSESELQGEDYLDVLLKANIFATRTTRSTKWTNQLFTDFRKVKIKNEDFIENDIFIRSLIDWQYDLFYGTSPFLAIKFDSEITKAGKTRQKDFYFDLGLALPKAFGFKETRLAYSRIFDLSENDRNGLNGIQVETLQQMTFNPKSKQKIRLQSQIEAIYYFDDKRESVEGRIFKLDFSTQLKFPITQNFTLKPALNGFFFKGNKDRKWSSAFEILIGLSYSQDWNF
ncbi:hypothetical protein IT568_02150 [bacterium]|nr:hypothetical protein [bacterium]